MQPGKVDLLTKEIIALAVSVTNGCVYCINSHTAAVQKLGLDDTGPGGSPGRGGIVQCDEQIADAYQIERTSCPRRRGDSS